MRAEPALLLRQQAFNHTEAVESHSDYLEEYLARVRNELDTAIVAAVPPIILLVQHFEHGVAPPLRHLPIAPHPRGHPVKLLEQDRVVVQPEF